MEYENIKKLIEDIGNSKLSSISIDFPDGTKISMTKSENVGNDALVVPNANQSKKSDNVGADESRHQNVGNDALVVPNTKPNENIKIVTSPMVGTFYLKPSPTAEQYVEVGKDIKIGDTICIIEAMKLMNEIESEYTGKITKILVEDGKPVEYGTPLFEIEV